MEGLLLILVRARAVSPAGPTLCALGYSSDLVSPKLLHFAEARAIRRASARSLGPFWEGARFSENFLVMIQIRVDVSQSIGAVACVVRHVRSGECVCGKGVLYEEAHATPATSTRCFVKVPIKLQDKPGDCSVDRTKGIPQHGGQHNRQCLRQTQHTCAAGRVLAVSVEPDSSPPCPLSRIVEYSL
jgi:hypothetical protein